MLSASSRLSLATALIAICTLIASCGGDDDDDAGAPAAFATAVVREVLEVTEPEAAPGQDFELTRVLIPPGDSIPPHTHPGPQLAVVVSGTLTYTVIEGDVEVTRNSGSESAETETISSGESIELEPGDSLVELPGVAHEADNSGDETVVIYLSSLFPEGGPPSSPAE
jgi:quercetin dioxygenase-like cupin family protein